MAVKINRLPAMLFFIAFICFTLLACNDHIRKNEIRITIELNSQKQAGYLYLKELNVRSIATIDSIKIDGKDRISFRVRTDSAGFYLVGDTPANYITILAEPGEDIQLSLTSKEFLSNYSVVGSPGSLILKEFYDHQAKGRKRVDSLGIAFDSAKRSGTLDRVKPQLDSIYKTIFHDQFGFTANLIGRSLPSLAAVFLLNQSFGPSLIFPERENIDFFRKVDSAVFLKYPKNKHALDHHNRVVESLKMFNLQKERAKRTEPGQMAPTIMEKDLSGKTYTLDQNTEKVTVLYFWQSMCALCRQENLRQRGFLKEIGPELVNFWMMSLDENPEMTAAAVKLDKPAGVVFNVKGGLNAALAQAYNITADLPVYYVIGRDGRIVTKGKTIEEIKDHIQLSLPKNTILKKL